jgi:hypothetical protein
VLQDLGIRALFALVLAIGAAASIRREVASVVATPLTRRATVLLLRLAAPE